MAAGKVSKKMLVSLLFIAVAGLITGLFSGMVRLGFFVGSSTQTVSPIAHSQLMINGYLGTLIGLERAGTLEKKWAFAAPACMAASTILLLAGPTVSGQWLLLSGSTGLTLVLSYLYFTQLKIYRPIMTYGAISLLIGNVLAIVHFLRGILFQVTRVSFKKKQLITQY